MYFIFRLLQKEKNKVTVPETEKTSNFQMHILNPGPLMANSNVTLVLFPISHVSGLCFQVNHMGHYQFKIQPA